MTKRQVTVRIDSDLRKQVLANAEKDGLSLTAVAEQGLALFLKKPKKRPEAVLLRALCNHMPLYLEQQTLAFLAWSAFPRTDRPFEEKIRKGWVNALKVFGQSPGYQTSLNKFKRLTKLPK